MNPDEQPQNLQELPTVPETQPSEANNHTFAPQQPEAPSLIDLRSTRAKKARLGTKIGKQGLLFIKILFYTAALSAILTFAIKTPHAPFILAALAIFLYVFQKWVVDDLQKLSVSPQKGYTGRLSREALSSLRTADLSPSNIWESLKNDWQSHFIMNHFYLPDEVFAHTLSPSASEAPAVFSTASELADKAKSETIETGHIVGALMLTSPQLINLFIQNKLSKDDIYAVVSWLDRGRDMLDQKPRDYGGIGRDWANGYTPQLDRFGSNVSLSIERQGSHYGWLSDSAAVTAMKSAFSQGAAAVAVVGESGSGKTSHVYALAQNLLEEKKDHNLEHRQVISLSASLIISSATRPGELEFIVNMLLNEAAHAGHIILFFDDAELFFSSGTGAFDASRILLPVVQSRAVQMIFAFSQHSWQNLKAMNTTLAGLITPIVLTEMPESSVMRVLEDTTLGLEHRHKVLITYDALKEAYRLSGRYEAEVAYPGKAINLLEQSLAYNDKGLVNARSIEQAIEQTRGVKVSSASATESDILLNLEAKIHERMINQSRAVSVVANALRRARAGVANPKRPIGSFLFLGPTGVGKTELAKAISAVYFGTEAHMIRLDMSEYQQPDDVSRLLSDGQNESKSLIMSVRQQPFGVVLLDEIEKAHPNILNLLLQLLDEGQLTDIGGRMASFKDCVVICTSNAGADAIRERVMAGEPLESFEDTLTNQLISSGQFKPELLNRFDEIVLFRPLNQAELLQVVGLMMKEVNQTLAPQNISVELTEAAATKIVQIGYDPRLGARPMRRALQRAVEDTVAQKILRGEISPGSHTTLDINDLTL